MAEVVCFPTLTGRAQGLFAAAAVPGPGVLLLPDVEGLAPSVLAAAEVLAQAGLSTLVLDLLRGEGAWWSGDLEQHPTRFLARDLAEVADDINAAAWFLLDHPQVKGSKMCVVGAGDGGALALAGRDTVLHLGADDQEFGPADTWRLGVACTESRLTVHTTPAPGAASSTAPDPTATIPPPPHWSGSASRPPPR
jgi:dienelactone hydrolase